MLIGRVKSAVDERNKIDQIAATPAHPLESLSRWGILPNPLGTSPQWSLVSLFAERVERSPLKDATNGRGYLMDSLGIRTIHQCH